MAPTTQLSPARQWLKWRILPLCLLALGFWLWRMVGLPLPWRSAVAVGLALLLAALPRTRAQLADWFEQLRTPSRAGRNKAAVVIAILATAYLIATGFFQGREFIAKFHDEHMLLLQMQMLARGRLWMPQHPLADFFESFHILVKPVYAGIYFPGTALMYVPTVWIGLPFWVLPAITSGVCVGLMFWIFTRFFDGVTGTLAALLLLSLTRFRYLSLIVMQHTVMLLLGLGLIWAYLNWRRKRTIGWTIVMGVCIGWGAITRPLDALCFAVPVGLAVAMDLWKRQRRDCILTGAIVVACAVPFLTLQLVMDKGITGHYLKLPYSLYAELYSPDWRLGFKPFDPNVRPQTKLLQKQIYYDQFSVPQARRHRPDTIWPIWRRERFPLIAAVTLPASGLVALVPLGLLDLRRRRWVLPLMFVGFVAGYIFFPYLLAHYCVVVAPAVIMLLLAGVHAVQNMTSVGRRGVSVFLTLAIAGVALSRFPELDPRIRDDSFHMPTMFFSLRRLPQMIKKPAIVLWTFHPEASVHEEPVYNTDVAWPDDAEIIRAHDLGAEKDQELFDYYAARQPDREVYIVDRQNLSIRDLGNVKALGARHHRGPSSSGPM